MKIAITGSTGLIGERLTADLRAEGHEVVRMVRRDPRGSDIVWRTEGPLDPAALRGIDGVVHLAGEPIGAGRWTSARKARILESRRTGTRTIAEAVAKSDGGPTVLVVASGISVYGDHGDDVITEETPAGDTFLAEVVTEWEAAADPARDAGVRVVHARTGIVLDPAGGSLQKMLPLFKLGLGGRFGSGREWWPWIAIDDVSRFYRWALTEESATGIYNVNAPNPVTNAEFTDVLSDVLNRPALLPVPAFGPKLLLGELAEELLFTSLRVDPARLRAEGFTFAYPDLGPALRQVLDR